MASNFEFQKLSGGLNDKAAQRTLADVYAIACTAYANQIHGSGELLIMHCLNTAQILWDWTADSQLVIAALLHHIFDERYINTLVSTDTVMSVIGKEGFALVDEVNRLSHIRQALLQQRAYQELALLLEKLPDISIALIKLASGLDIARKLSALPDDEKKYELAHFKLGAYGPTAYRLGMRAVKQEIEELCMEVLFPGPYKVIQQYQAELSQVYEETLHTFQQALDQRSQAEGLLLKTFPSRRSIYRLFQALRAKKLLEFTAQTLKEYLKPSDLQDLIVLTTTKADCYQLLGLVHEMGRPYAETFRDYIATPKPNGYAALHTTIDYKGNELRVFIRTEAMHTVAMAGITAVEAFQGWRERAVPSCTNSATDKTNAVPNSPVNALVDSLFQPPKIDDSVQVFTPHGEKKQLTRGATPLDFAYHIHTELGHYYSCARVNGKTVPDSYKLQNGDVVEIIVDRNASPTRRWLALVVTKKARQKIREWLNQAPKQRGYDLLSQELTNRGLDWDDLQVQTGLEKIVKAHFGGIEQLLEEVGTGRIAATLVVNDLRQPSKLPLQFRRVVIAPEVRQSVTTKRLWVKLAKCCRPAYPDPIIGCVRNCVVSVHKMSCGNAAKAGQQIPVAWEQRPTELFKLEMHLDGYDRLGLMRDITTVVTNQVLNMSDLRAEKTALERVRIFLTLELTVPRLPNTFLTELRSIDGITQVSIGDGLLSLAAVLGATQSQKAGTFASVGKLHELANPYSPGRPIHHKHLFFGRERELRALVNQLTPASQSTCVLLYAQRRTGKTSLVRRVAEDIYVRREYMPVFVDLAHFSANSDYEVIRYISRYIHREVAELDFAFEPLQSLKAEEDLYLRFEESLVEFNRRSGKQILLILDEFDALFESLQKGVLSPRFFSALRSWTQTQPLTLLLVGYSSLADLLTQHCPQLSNVFTMNGLGPLQQDDARALIVRPVQGLLDYENHVVEQILTLTACHPYYIHLLCAKLFANVTSRYRTLITSKDLEETLAELTNNISASYFTHLWSDKEPLQKTVLTYLAHTSREEGHTGWGNLDAIAHFIASDYNLQARLSTTLEVLCKLDTLEKQMIAGQGCYRIKLPLFHQWIINNWPL